MARNTWQIHKQTGSGYAWELSDDVFYVPNESLELGKTSTLTPVKLASGGNSYVIPEVKFTLEPLTISWVAIPDSDGFQDTLEGYVESNVYLKIIDHLGQEMTGYITSVNRVWLLGEVDTYDLQAVFVRC